MMTSEERQTSGLKETADLKSKVIFAVYMKHLDGTEVFSNAFNLIDSAQKYRDLLQTGTKLEITIHKMVEQDV